MILTVQERKIPAHRVVLAAASHFFNLMFTSKYLKVKHTVFSMRTKWGLNENIFPTFEALKKLMSQNSKEIEKWS